MFKVTRAENDRLDIEMSGKLDTESMKTALDDLMAAAEGIKNGKMLYDIVDYQFPSPGAIWLELSRLPALIGLMNQFDRAAVLTDDAWLKLASEIEGLFYPGLEIKAFRREEKEEAEAWLEQ
jgi:hypothetical protein